MRGFVIKPLTPEHRDWATSLICDHWGSPIVVTRGKGHDTRKLKGFVAVSGREPVGLLTYRVGAGQCEIVSLDSLMEGIGVGSALIEAVNAVALRRGCRRLWLITTNDNLDALRFYQKRGFHLVAVHRDALRESRRLKPSLPEIGIDGIPLRDEIELEILL
jgi:GNAT superfamily N-acetyltransferase